MTKILTLAAAEAAFRESISTANDITVDRCDTVTLKNGGKFLDIDLGGDGVGNPTRRLYLRNSRVRKMTDDGMFIGTPKKDRNVRTYRLYVADTATTLAAAMAQHDQSVVDAKQAKIDAKVAAKAEAKRIADEAKAAVAAALAAEKAAAESTETIVTEGLESAEPVATGAEVESDETVTEVERVSEDA